MRVSDRDLAAWLAMALEPPRHLEIARALAASPALVARLERLSHATPEPQRSSWILPPPGLGAFTSAPVAVMGDEAPWIRIALPQTAAPTDRVLVLERQQGEWTVISPNSPSETLTVADLPQEESVRQLDVAPNSHAERIGVVLVPAFVVIDWNEPPETRWEALMEGVLSGNWLVGTLSLIDRAR